MKKLEYEVFLDKVYGGWLGKCLGGAAGAPVEGIKKIIPCEDFKEMLRADLPNDDLDLQLLWLEVMEEKGLSVTAKDLAEAWDLHCWYPFNEYGIFLKNYERGIMPPYSGAFNNPVFSEGEGCPIRSEIWGMLFPGDPESAARYASMDGSLDHTENAVWIEMYYAAMEASAFFESDIPKLITEHIDCLPKGSKARCCAEDVLQWQKENPDDWMKTRKLMLRKYGHFDFTNAVTNLGIVLTALLYGKENLDTVINIGFRSGFDTDCTCATAAAIWGIAYGEKSIPADLKVLVNDEFVIGIDVKRENQSIRRLAEDTCSLALKLAGDSIRKQKIEMKIIYKTQPAIGFEDSCTIEAVMKNNGTEKAEDTLNIEDLPKGWCCEPAGSLVSLEPGQERSVEFRITTTEEVSGLSGINILKACFAGAEMPFGIAGAAEWEAAGPYFDALDKEDPEGIPSAHGEGCNLPTLECMLNNAVYLEKLYLEENHFEKAFQEEETCRIHGYEDLLPLDETFTFKGQGCIYLKQEVEVPEDRTVWAVIGNNDGFRLWINQELQMERDEIRLWTPYNNYQRIPLKKGRNQIVVKLLKRTESMKFSMAFRMDDGGHFHKKRWCTDIRCCK